MYFIVSEYKQTKYNPSVSTILKNNYLSSLVSTDGKMGIMCENRCYGNYGYNIRLNQAVLIHLGSICIDSAFNSAAQELDRVVTV
jgi:hypothetical protein